MAEFLPFTSDEIPVQKVFEINDTDFTYRLQLNTTFDYFILTILDNEDNILFSNKLVYKNDVLISGKHLLPGIGKQIIPFDTKNQIRVLNFATLNNPVKLFLV